MSKADIGCPVVLWKVPTCWNQTPRGCGGCGIGWADFSIREPVTTGREPFAQSFSSQVSSRWSILSNLIVRVFRYCGTNWGQSFASAGPNESVQREGLILLLEFSADVPSPQRRDSGTTHLWHTVISLERVEEVVTNKLLPIVESGGQVSDQNRPVRALTADPSKAQGKPPPCHLIGL